MKLEGEQQIQERRYSQNYEKSSCEIITALIVADGEQRRIVVLLERLLPLMDDLK